MIWTGSFGISYLGWLFAYMWDCNPCFLCTAALPAAELHGNRPQDSHAPRVLWRKHRGQPQTREGNQVRAHVKMWHCFCILFHLFIDPLHVSFLTATLSFSGVTLRSSTTPTSTTATGCFAPPFPRLRPSARRWWRCGTAPGGATKPRCTWSPGRGPSATRAPP